MIAQQSRTTRLLSVLGLTQRPVAALFCLFLLVDVLLVVVHIVFKLIGEPPGFFDLAADRSYGEFANGMKMLWAAAMLILLTVRERAPVFALGALAFIYMITDDWLVFHERFGAAFAHAHPGLGLFAPHVGELLWMLGLAILFGTLGLLTYARSPAGARRICIVLLALFVMLAVFAVGLDAVHHMLFDSMPFNVTFNIPFTPVEDGGELLILTTMTAFLFAVAFTEHRPELGGRLARLATMPRLRATRIG